MPGSTLICPGWIGLTLIFPRYLMSLTNAYQDVAARAHRARTALRLPLHSVCVPGMALN